MSEEAARRCWVALGYALTGQQLTAPDAPTWQACDVVAWLADNGWDVGRLVERRQQAQQARQPWPTRLPEELMAGLEFARYGALLAQVRKHTGLDGLTSTIHRGPLRIGPQEARLMAELPPHNVLH